MPVGGVDSVVRDLVSVGCNCVSVCDGLLLR